MFGVGKGKKDDNAPKKCCVPGCNTLTQEKCPVCGDPICDLHRISPDRPSGGYGGDGCSYSISFGSYWRKPK